MSEPDYTPDLPDPGSAGQDQNQGSDAALGAVEAVAGDVKAVQGDVTQLKQDHLAMLQLLVEMSTILQDFQNNGVIVRLA